MKNTTTVTSREFNQNSSRAKREASKGPVIITERGKPAHVLLSIQEYRKLTGQEVSIVDLLGMDTDVDWEPVVLRDMARPADLS